MEPAKDLVERPLPPLTKVRGTLYPSESTERVSARYFHEWKNFESTVLQACATLDLSRLVPVTHDEDTEFIVASELGLTSRFTKHLCDSVIRALSVTDLSGLRFSDHQAVKGHSPTKVPDVVLLALSDETARLVIELKTFWTFRLEDYSVRRGPNVLESIENYLGQVIGFMRASDLRFGVLSTYKSTVFIQRTADFRFELSVPIPREAVRPSVRQCLIAISVLAGESPNYCESDTFNPSQLYCPTNEYHQASIRPSPLRMQIVGPEGGSNGEEIGANSLLFGSDDGVARMFFNCNARLMGTGLAPQGKAIFETTWNGEQAIAKCWGPSFYQQFAHETRTYQKLAEKSPEGYDFFTTDRQHGIIYCSSVFPRGFVLILKKVPGEPLIGIWDSLSNTEKAHIRSELHKAIVVLRSIGVVCLDNGQHNVLYDRPTGLTTLIDFEVIRLIEPNSHTRDAPELWSIFGPPDSPMNRHLGG